MRSASGERIAVAGTRRKAPIIALAALALVIAGVGFWRMNAKEFVERDKSGGGTGDVVDGAIAKATDVGFGGTAAGEATGLSGNVGAGGTVAGETPDTGTRAGGSKVAIVPAVIPIHPAAARTVKVMIASTPAGADVCLAKDRILLGRTRFDWKTEKKPGTAKLLIRKRGYRGDEITVNLDHDVKKAVTLDKLGPDDIDDSDTCEKR